MKDHNSVSDEEMMDDRRQESHIASVVAKIKTEKKEASSYSRDIKDKDSPFSYKEKLIIYES